MELHDGVPAPRMLTPRHHMASALVDGIVCPLPSTLLILGLMIASGFGTSSGWSETLALAMLSWLVMATVSVPAAMTVLSLLWPVTRRGTSGGRWVCLAAGITTGMLLAPLGSEGWRGASPGQLLMFALSGLVASGTYCALLARFGRRPTGPTLKAIFA
ncbi:hypothetical protein [Sphingomonas lenta]|uniref:Uncharacterized protein n=1 Tax=Sphingomonas lenta TaxID=1141887 RepID=A0A2A2SB15_9SPHN|nr:hypothetical protein [Sphingomonas lenta]PAX06372.1 hypothetical protein CKY28_17360 [Sphingomonas lenta]